MVTFTNAVTTGQFKICKQSPEPTLQGVTFTFDFNYEVNGLGVKAEVELTPGTCSALSDPIPVVGPDGSEIPITVTEAPTPTVEISDIAIINAASSTIQGNSPTATFSVNQGVTTITYTNVRTPPPVGV